MRLYTLQPCGVLWVQTVERLNTDRENTLHCSSQTCTETVVMLSFDKARYQTATVVSPGVLVLCSIEKYRLIITIDVDIIDFCSLSEAPGVSLILVEMDLNVILRIWQEFYDENPMMITTLVLFFLVYAYYRARVVQLPMIYCRDNSRLHRQE